MCKCSHSIRPFLVRTNKVELYLNVKRHVVFRIFTYYCDPFRVLLNVSNDCSSISMTNLTFIKEEILRCPSREGTVVERKRYRNFLSTIPSHVSHL